MMHKHWQKVSLSEILVERNETPDPDLLRDGQIPIISKIRFSDGEIVFRTNTTTKTKMILIYPGDLVLSGINAMKGAIAIYDPNSTQKAAATIHYSAYQVNKDLVEVRYIWWLLRSQYFQDNLSKQVPQGIKTELRAKLLMPIVIPLPTINEQQKIINLINSFDKKIYEVRILLETASGKTKDFINSYLAYRFSDFRGLDAEETSLEDLLIEKPKNGKSTKLGAENYGIKCLTLASMKNCLIDISESKPISLSEKEAKDYAIKKDDIYICRGNGSRHLIGQAVTSESNEPNIIFPDLMIRIRPDYRRIKKEYLLYYWQSRLMRDQIEEKAKTTAGIWKINQQHLLSLRIHFPKDLSQQEKIVNKVKNVRELVSQLVEKQETTCLLINVLKLSFIDKIFQNMTYLHEEKYGDSSRSL